MSRLLCYRVIIIITLYLGYTFYNLTRKSMSFMLPHFASNTHSNSSASLNITKNDIGIIVSSQNLAYAISKLFFGMLSDVASNRVLFGSGLFLSGLLNIGFRKEIKIHNLYFLSFFIGLAQGPAWPTCAKILRNWLPKEQFGTWWSILSTGSNVAGVLGPLAATFIALKYHWSLGFMILGCICMSVGYLSILVLRNKPTDVGLPDPADDDIPDVNFEQMNHDDKSEDEDEEEEKEIRWSDQIKMMLKYPFFLSICLAYFMFQLVKTIFTDVAQVYLIKVIKVDPYTSSYFLSTFEFAGIFGSIFSGIITDMIFNYKSRKVTKTNEAKLADTPIRIRFVAICTYTALLIASMHCLNFYVKPGVDTKLLYSIAAASGALCYGAISLLGVMAMEFTSNEYSGTSHAVVSLAANFGGVFAGIPFSLVSKFYTWGFAFKLVEYFVVLVFFFLFVFRKCNKYFVPITHERKTQ